MHHMQYHASKMANILFDIPFFPIGHVCSQCTIVHHVRVCLYKRLSLTTCSHLYNIIWLFPLGMSPATIHADIDTFFPSEKEVFIHYSRESSCDLLTSKQHIWRNNIFSKTVSLQIDIQRNVVELSKELLHLKGCPKVMLR